MAGAYHQALLDRLGTIGSIGEQPVLPKITPTQRGGGYSSPGWNAGNPTGNQQQRLIQFGKWLQSRGYRVSEHPAFGGVEPVHTRNSAHYSKRAFDLNYGPGGTSRQETEAINRILGASRQYGLRYIWQAPGHYNHGHFYY